tara:strand:- start:1265 stop:1591 length:327 start_codon:yes stop_codon:yes gene_type:complete
LRAYLSFLGFGGLVKLLKRSRGNKISINNIRYVSKSLDIICSFTPYITCLIRAGVLKIIFSDEKDLEINIGIKNNKKVFESHAWVTFNNEIILNSDFEIDSYKIIYKI